MRTPLFLPYRADPQRCHHQLQQVGSPDTLLHQAHDTVARWCLLPDLPPDTAQQLWHEHRGRAAKTGADAERIRRGTVYRGTRRSRDGTRHRPHRLRLV